MVKAETILKVESVYFECDKEDMLKAKRGGGVDNTVWAIAIKLCREHASMKLAEMGSHLEYAVRAAWRRL